MGKLTISHLVIASLAALPLSGFAAITPEAEAGFKLNVTTDYTESHFKVAQDGAELKALYGFDASVEKYALSFEKAFSPQPHLTIKPAFMALIADDIVDINEQDKQNNELHSKLEVGFSPLSVIEVKGKLGNIRKGETSDGSFEVNEDTYFAGLSLALMPGQAKLQFGVDVEDLEFDENDNKEISDSTWLWGELSVKITPDLKTTFNLKFNPDEDSTEQWYEYAKRSSYWKTEAKVAGQVTLFNKLMRNKNGLGPEEDASISTEFGINYHF